MVEISLDPRAVVSEVAIDTMELYQKDYQRRLGDYEEYRYTLRRRKFFARGYDKVKEDVDYALAVTKRVVETKESREIRQELQQTMHDKLGAHQAGLDRAARRSYFIRTLGEVSADVDCLGADQKSSRSSGTLRGGEADSGQAEAARRGDRASEG